MIHSFLLLHLIVLLHLYILAYHVGCQLLLCKVLYFLCRDVSFLSLVWSVKLHNAIGQTDNFLSMVRLENCTTQWECKRQQFARVFLLLRYYDRISIIRIYHGYEMVKFYTLDLNFSYQYKKSKKLEKYKKKMFVEYCCIRVGT